MWGGMALFGVKRPIDGGSAESRDGRNAASSGTIRGRILIAFLCMSMITAALGGYAVMGIQRAGVLVAKTFDESLMSINYARAAATDFAVMQAAFARRWVTVDAEKRAALDLEIETLHRALADDLAIASERSQSSRAVQAAANVKSAVDNWNSMRVRLIEGDEPDVNWDTLDRYAATVDQQVDLLVNYTAGDGFTYRQTARSSVAREINFNIAGTVLALLISAAVAWLLARRIIGPVAAASEVAGRIANGELDVDIPNGSGDELGALLTAMRGMRDNIRKMMAREVEQRRSAQSRLADALESSREGVVLADADGRLALANPQAADFLGIAANLMQPGTPIAALGPVMARAGAGTAQARELHQPLTDEVRLADGRWLRMSQSPTRDGGSIVVCSDITVLKDQEETLKGINIRLDAALDNMSQGLCLYDAHDRLQVVNRRFCEIFGLPAEKVQPGLTYKEILELSIAAGNHLGKSVADLLAVRMIDGTQFLELSIGRVVACALRPTSDGGWVATYEDVTERRQAEAKIIHMARHDMLTGLPNRVLFHEQLEQSLKWIRRGEHLALLYLDLDHFKSVNDTLGHPVGDELLKAVAVRLRRCVRETDTVARLGGDEFAIIQTGVEQPTDTTELVTRIYSALREPYDCAGHQLAADASIGIAMAPGDGTDSDQLLKNADLAVYGAKSDGRSTYRFFEPGMDARVKARRTLEFDLRQAIMGGELELFYQPLVSVRDNTITGCEALLRWRHPERGMISPADFIPIAEETGLITSLGEWALRTACIEAATWPSDLRIAVNVSPVQFKSGNLVQLVINALAAARLPANRLELEITEAVLIRDDESTLAILHQLRKLGVRIGMDDFGTGYSSLSYLQRFPFDKIKIDRSFIKDVAEKDGSHAIVQAVINIAKSRNITTTAEGVETEQQLSSLRALDCTEMQGWLFSRAIPSPELKRLFASHRERERGAA
jgi:diguanylate cyclase (GGDEF)-like protein